MRPLITPQVSTIELVVAGSGKPLAKLEWRPDLTWQQVLDRATKLVSTHHTYQVRLFINHGGTEIVSWEEKVPQHLQVPITVLNMTDARVPELKTRYQSDPDYLVKCATQGDTDLVRILVGIKADVNHVDTNGNTGLMWVVMDDHTDTAKFLIGAKADVNHTDRDGTTILMWGTSNGCTDTIALLVGSKANINGADINGDAALLWAASSGRMDTVELLIDAKVDINHANLYGETALICTARYDQPDIAKVLIDAKADISHITKSGHTALQHAEDRNHREVVWILREAQ